MSQRDRKKTLAVTPRRTASSCRRWLEAMDGWLRKRPQKRVDS